MRKLTEVQGEHYDLLSGTGRDIEAQVDFLDRIFKKNGVKTVLDCGCGTGTHAIMLAKRGYKVTAFDYNVKILGIAKKKAKKEKAKIQFKVGDIRNFKFGRYDAVISLFSVIMFACRGMNDLRKSLRCIKRSINKGGIAFFETCTPHLARYDFELKKIKYDDTKVARVRTYEKTKTKNLLDATYTYVVKHKGKPAFTTTAHAKNRLFTKQEITQALKACGLKLTKLYGSFIGKKYEDYNKKSIFISPLFRIKKP
jgi:2-polyprenyl-3-methyl-5-hydroxy-6-metoxy-1,4-benzoquinol methylase